MTAPQQPWPPAGPPPRVQTGAVAWWCSLIVFAIVPFVSAVVASIAMIAVGASQRRKGELARRNGVRAMNWGITYLLSTCVLVALHMWLIISIPDGDPAKKGFFPIGIPISLWLLHSVVFAVLGVVAAVTAGKQQVACVNGIPFIRG